jgi:4a-hydroxytetrahydrobiopterin dehydratase
MTGKFSGDSFWLVLSHMHTVGTGKIIHGMKKLSQRQVDTRLEKIPQWSQNGDAIQRTFQFENFVGSMRFLNAVAEAAERAQHHPDILVRWNKVTLTLSTHDASGITEKDMAFAANADQISGLPSV